MLPGIDIDVYHAEPFFSNSKGKTFVQEGPWAYYRKHITRDVPSEDTDALKLGRVFDMIQFDPPGTFEKRCVIKPDGMSFASTEGKLWRAQQQAKGLEIVTKDDCAMFLEMAASIQANPIARQLFSMGKPQITIRRELPGLGLTVQARPDWINLEGVALNDGRPYLLDLKTCADLDRFSKNALGLGYHRQIALGQWLLAKEGINADAYLVVTEKALAGRTKVFRIPEQFLAQGWEDTKKVLEQISARTKSGDWTDPQTEIEDLQPPVWAERQAMEGVAV